MYLQKRSRILRATSSIRSLVAETVLTPNDFIAPLFIDEGQNVEYEIPSMPNYFRRSVDLTIKEIKELYSLGVKCVLLFIKCKDELKDNTGKEAWNKDGLMQRSIKAIKDAVPEMYVMTDVALDPYSSYGHDGIVKDGEIVNDETVEALVKMSRKPEILADAAYHILKKPSSECTGNLFIDEEVLAKEGITDLDKYAVTPGGKLYNDLFV